MLEGEHLGPQGKENQKKVRGTPWPLKKWRHLSAELLKLQAETCPQRESVSQQGACADFCIFRISRAKRDFANEAEGIFSGKCLP